MTDTKPCCACSIIDSKKYGKSPCIYPCGHIFTTCCVRRCITISLYCPLCHDDNSIMYNAFAKAIGFIPPTDDENVISANA